MSSGIEHLLRDLAPQVLGVMARRHRDFAAAEDAVQEALLAASIQWPKDGVPGNPRGWLIQVASRKVIDEARSNAARQRRESEVAMEAGYVLPATGSAPEDDDTLPLLFYCCHPSLTTSSAVALTLRAVGGLTTAEIAKAFLVPESTMAQRISRAKQTIKESGIPFRAPEGEERERNLRSVLHVLYLVFNEGYSASQGEQFLRTDLASEGIRLARALCRRIPANPEAAGLLALMLLTDARKHARMGSNGEIIPLDEQDRALWDHDLIGEGIALLSEALRQGSVGPYQLQAAIAAVHDEAPDAKQTDWPQIVALYELLIKMTGNPMARLNHAVAVAMDEGPEKGLRLLASLEGDERLSGHHRFHAVRAHLLEMAGDAEQAVIGYQTAAVRTGSLPERNYLMRRAARLREAGR